MADEEAFELMRRQHGVASRRQLRQIGVTDRQIDHRVARGHWIAVQRGVYRHAVVPETWRSRLMAACVAIDGLASHRAAAHLHGIEGFGANRLEVTVAESRRIQLPGGIVHRSTQMELADPVLIDGIPCTGLARTVLDMSHRLPFRRLEDAVDALLRDHRLEWGDLYSVLARHARRGRNGAGSLRGFLDARGGDEHVPLSAWSRMVSDLLVANGLPEPRFEYRIEDPGGLLVAQVDLAYPASRVAIELDSVRWHLNRTSFEEDRRRWNRLTTRGWTVLAFTWSDYADRPLGLVSHVRTARRRNSEVRPR